MVQTLTADPGRMPLGLPLQGTLMRARDYTNQYGHAEITLEHLLLALTEDEDASVVLRASRVDLDRLRDDVTAYVSAHGERGPAGMRVEPRISSGLTQILKYASLAAQQGRRPRIDGAIVLAAVIGDGRSTAAALLKAQGLTFDAAIRALQQGSTGAPGSATASERPPSAVATSANGTAGGSLREATEGAVRRAGGTFFDTEDILAAARARVQSREAQTRVEPAAGAAPAQLGAPQPSPAPLPDAATSPAAAKMPPSSEVRAPGGVALDAALAEPAATRPDKPSAASRASPSRAMQPESASNGAEASARPVEVRRAEPEGASPPPLPAAATAAANPPPIPTAALSQRPTGANPPPLPVASAPAEPVIAPALPALHAPAWAPPPMPTLSGRGGAAVPPPVPPPSAEATAPQVSHQPPPPPPASVMPPHAPPAEARQRPLVETHRGPPSGPPPPGPQLQSPPHAPPSPGPPLHALPMQAPGLRPAPYRGEPPPGPPIGPPPGHDASRRQASRRPAIEATQISHAIPARMHVGVARAVEVRIARTPLVAGTPSTQPYAQRGDVASARAISVRLRPMKGAFAVDATSPETQWEKPAGGGRLGGDTAVWRFLVTPQEAGTGELSLHVNAHIMGADGILAETVLPEQIVAVRIAKSLPGRLRRAGRVLLAAIGGVAVFEAVQLASRFGMLATLRRLIGL